MSKNPYINAVCAALYIVLIVLLITYGPSSFVKNQPDTILAPIAMLSLLVLSVAFMGYIFFLQPALLYTEGKKREAVELFSKTLAVFAAITVVVVLVAFSF